MNLLKTMLVLELEVDGPYLVNCCICGKEQDEEIMIYCDECNKPACEKCIATVQNQGFEEAFCKRCAKDHPEVEKYDFQYREAFREAFDDGYKFGYNVGLKKGRIQGLVVTGVFAIVWLIICLTIL